jgi:hypothetical protein
MRLSEALRVTLAFLFGLAGFGILVANSGTAVGVRQAPSPAASQQHGLGDQEQGDRTLHQAAQQLHRDAAATAATAATATTATTAATAAAATATAATATVTAAVADPAPSDCPRPARPYHVLLTASSGAYQLWQTRVFHHHYLRIQRQVG